MQIVTREWCYICEKGKAMFSGLCVSCDFRVETITESE